MGLPECNSTNWKSKFVDGLPPLFAERIKKVLRGTSMSINYETFSYKKLICVCTQEDLALCNEIKLNHEINKHRLNERQQLGEFYEQFAIDTPRNRKKPHKKKKDFQNYKKKRGSFDKKRERRKKRKSFYKDKKDFIKSKNPNACYKCGRIGHYAKDCKVKEKIKNLDLDDNIKDSLYKILLNSSSENSSPENSDEESLSTDEDLRVLQEVDFSTSEDGC